MGPAVGKRWHGKSAALAGEVLGSSMLAPDQGDTVRKELIPKPLERTLFRDFPFEAVT